MGDITQLKADGVDLKRLAEEGVIIFFTKYSSIIFSMQICILVIFLLVQRVAILALIWYYGCVG
ncbi:Ubiquinone biosynthesis monooxygenase UbiB [uncultured Gammaproteobacteria bacterium]|nr:Ubiquinone biosynthesis monooxygenase UbiB [uncultured Gammaproteobacteria bacterium]